MDPSNHVVYLNPGLEYVEWGRRVIEISEREGIMAVVAHARIHGMKERRRRLQALIFDRNKWTEEAARDFADTERIIW